MVNKNNMEKGSVLVLTLIAVMILSIMVTGLLTVGTTEIYTTQNYQLKRNAYYSAVAGLEEIRKIIDETEGWANKLSLTASFSDINPDIAEQGYGIKTAYMIGTMYNYEEGLVIGATPRVIETFKVPFIAGFPVKTGDASVPKLRAMQVNITGVASYLGKRSKKTAYSELVAGILVVLPPGGGGN